VQPLVAAARVLSLGAAEIIGIEQIQFFNSQLEPEGIAAGRLAGFILFVQQNPGHLRMNPAVIATADGVNDLPRFRGLQQRQFFVRHIIPAA